MRNSITYRAATVTLLCLFVAATDAGEVYVDATFMYQGQLVRDGVPVSESCDMRFKLRTNPFGTDETDVLATLFFDGSNAERPPVQVSNGLFDVVLDFPFWALAQRPVWLDVGVQCPPGVNGFYAGLLPRQEITSVPYSVHTRGLSVDEFGRVGVGTTDPTSTLHIDGNENNGTNAALRVESGSQILLIDGDEIDSNGTLSINKNSAVDTLLANGGGLVGVGTTSPTSPLHLGMIGNWGPTVGNGWGDFSLNNGVVGLSFGVATGGGGTGDARIWSTGGTERLLLGNAAAGSILVLSKGGNVGIGTASPQAKLDIVGDANPTVSIRSESTSDQDAGLSIRGARNSTTTADVASIDLRNFDDNEGAGTDYAMARIAAGMADAAGQTGYLRFNTNDGTGLKERLRIDKQGRVGIGTTAPSAAMHLRDPGTEVELRMNAGGSWTAGLRQTNSSLLSLFNGAGATNRLTISPGGNVGIGTTQPASRLHIDDGTDVNAAAGGYLILGDLGGLNIGIDDNEIAARTNGVAARLTLNADGGDIILGPQDAPRVGIGKSNPSVKLDVEGSGSDSGGAAGFNEVAARFHSTSGGHTAASIDCAADKDSILYFAESGEALWVMRADAQADSNWAHSQFELRYHAGGTNEVALEVVRNVDQGIFTFYTHGRVIPWSDDAYDLGAPSGAFAGGRWRDVWASNAFIQTSDIREKKDVVDLPYGLPELLRLRPVSFRWDRANDDGSLRYGLIAQEVDAVLPEAVVKQEDPEALWAMSYATLVPVLINAVQDQQRIIEELRGRVRAFEARESKPDETIEARLSRLERVIGQIRLSGTE